MRIRALLLQDYIPSKGRMCVDCIKIVALNRLEV